MSNRSHAADLEELLNLRERGVITDEEFLQVKQEILGKMGARATTVAQSFASAVDDSEDSFKNLAWFAYWGSVATIVLGLIPPLMPFGLLLHLVILVVAALKIGPASQTIYGGHFKNILTIAIVDIVATAAFIVFGIVTLGFGFILGGLFILALSIWCIYRLVKGMMNLNDGKAYGR